MTAVDPVFNEPSLSPLAADEQQARDRMDAIINILVRMPGYGLGKSLRISKEFYLLDLAQGYSMTAWISDQRVKRDQLRFFLGLAAKAPFIRPTDGQALEQPEDAEVACLGQSHAAFFAPYVLDAPLVSFDNDGWAEPDLPAIVTRLDGDGELREEGISLVNFARLAHFDHHAPWFARRCAATDAGNLWARRSELFPHLIFCNSVEGQLTNHDSILSLIIARLENMERVAALGRPFNKDDFAFRCHATSAATFQQFGTDYEFTAPDGSRSRCGWHFYLPDGRRLYFSADYIIGYVGGHLPTVRFH